MSWILWESGHLGACFTSSCATTANASGWIVVTTSAALDLDELVTQFSMRLQAATRQIEQLKNPQASEPEASNQ